MEVERAVYVPTSAAKNAAEMGHPDFWWCRTEKHSVSGELRSRGSCGVGEEFELDDQSLDRGGVVLFRSGLEDRSLNGLGDGPEQEMGFGVVDFQLDLARVGDGSSVCVEIRLSCRADDEDEVGFLGRRNKLPVSPGLQGGVGGVVRSVRGEFFGGFEVDSAVGEEDFLRGADGRGDGCLLSGEGWRCEKE